MSRLLPEEERQNKLSNQRGFLLGYSWAWFCTKFGADKTHIIKTVKKRARRKQSRTGVHIESIRYGLSLESRPGTGDGKQPKWHPIYICPI